MVLSYFFNFKKNFYVIRNIAINTIFYCLKYSYKVRKALLFMAGSKSVLYTCLLRYIVNQVRMFP